MGNKNTFKNKILWDDISRLVDEAAKKAYRQAMVKKIITESKGMIQSGKRK